MKRASSLNRRQVVKLGMGTTVGVSALALGGSRVFAAGEEPHFFINVVVAGGVDPTYWFDGRPLEMTDKGLVSNYLYKNSESEANTTAGARIDFLGKNGTKSIRTTITEPLMKFKDEMTVINGILMNGNGVASHGQNMYTLFTGKTVGGYDSWVPMIGARAQNPIESVHVGGWKGDGNTAPKNFGGSVQLDGYKSMKLFKDIKESAEFDPADPVAQFIMKRYAASGTGTDAFSLGCKAIVDGLGNAQRLNTSLNEAASAGSNTQANGALMAAMQMVQKLFAGNVTSSVTIMMDRDMGSSFDIDSHDASIAKGLPKNYGLVIADIAAVIDFMKATEYKNGKSLLDVTTLMISSEFGRPYRQISRKIWATGTDHNQLINSMILLGKGIKPGLLLGASDMDTVAEADAANVSGAHKACEKGSIYSGTDLIMPMGRPFDFETGLVRTDKPAEFKITDYLTIQSVTNTMLRLFGYTDDKMFRDPDGKQFRGLEKHLLTNA